MLHSDEESASSGSSPPRSRGSFGTSADSGEQGGARPTAGAWMQEVMCKLFDKDLKEGLDELVHPRAAAVEEKTQAFQEAAAVARQQLAAQVEGFDSQLADVTAKVLGIQESIRSALGRSYGGLSRRNSAVPPRTPDDEAMSD